MTDETRRTILEAVGVFLFSAAYVYVLFVLATVQ